MTEKHPGTKESGSSPSERKLRAAETAWEQGYSHLGRPGVFQGHGSGHIHESFRVLTDSGGVYLLQKINRGVFSDPEALTANISLVTTRQKAFLERTGCANPERRCLHVQADCSGAPAFLDEAGGYWRVFDFIQGTYTLDQAESAQAAGRAAGAFGRFLVMLADLPPGDLNLTIPGFHDTPARFKALQDAIEKDPADRRRLVEAELKFALERRAESGRLLELQRRGVLPLRVVHNDTKINNVLFDAESGEGICVIDLDTVMPGLAAYDFGDLARTVLSPLAEDDPEPCPGQLRLPFFRALVEGFLDGTGGLLTGAEIAELPFGAWLITLENGVRFLTDYLEGDRYFRVNRPRQNLDRCRNQFSLAAEIERNLPAMAGIVREVLAGNN